MEILKYIFVIFIASPFIGFIFFGSLMAMLDSIFKEKFHNFMDKVNPLKNTSTKTKIISIYILFGFFYRFNIFY